MKIIAFADLHNQFKVLLAMGQILSEADVILMVGDLTNDGNNQDVLQMFDLVRQFNTAILAVPGNWDGPEVQKALSSSGINLDRKVRLLGEYAFIGMGASLPCPVKTPNELTEIDFSRSLDEAVTEISPDRPIILVCHQPPIRTNTDRTQTGQHIGSNAVRAFIECVQPLVCFTGHIHEARGMDRIGTTQIINPGPLSEGYYAYAQVFGPEVNKLEIRAIPPH